MFSRSRNSARHDPLDHDDEWHEAKRPPRDWKKVFLVIGLGTLSWVATYVGMLELIQANMGDLDFTTKIVIGFSVAMLMTMIIWLLDQMFAPHPFAIKLSYVAGYLFLTLISVGFGFGFYWKVLESRSEASRSAESAVGQVQAALVAGAARLDQLQGTLEQLTRISQEKAVVERESGASCPNSRPGDGPRRRLRDADAQRFSFAAEFVKGRSGQVKGDMQALEGDLKRISTADPSTFDPETGTRNRFLQALSRKLELTAANFNAFRTDPQLRQIRSELADRANRTTFPTGSGSATFSCPDPQLQSALFGVVKAIDQLPVLDKPEIATVEGAQAVVEAFRRLSATLQGALVLKLPPSADDIRELQKRAVRSVEPGGAATRGVSGTGLSEGGLSQRDYIPLAIALFVDLCLLLVSIGRPMNRLGGLVPKMREAERGPVYQILSRFDEIHRDAKIREKFDVFRHVVFDFHGDYYVAVPLDAPRNRNPEEVANLQLEAHLLANLFASFEKEKIFSRVYNPLLSRKAIQKKLWRQGSKFAASQAFRIYRFRDGAWSDIILGAVMGAARRAKSERVRRAREAGPQLDVAETAAAGATVETGVPEPQTERNDTAARVRAEEILAATVGTEGQAAGDRAAVGAAGSVEEGREAMEAKRLAAMLGPYADDDDSDAPEGLRPSRAAKRSWPYRTPLAPPGEAQVELLPANSNTGPHGRRRGAETDAEPAFTAIRDGQIGVWGSDVASGEPAPRDNIIPLPMLAPLAGRPTPGGGGEPRAHVGAATAARAGGDEPRGAFTDILARAIAVSSEPVAHGPVRVRDAAPDLGPEFAPDLPAETANAAAVDMAAPQDAFDEEADQAVTMAVARAAGRQPAATSDGMTDMLSSDGFARSVEVSLAGGLGPLEAHMSVLITQPAPDFQIPLKAMSDGQPIAFLKTGARITVSEPGLVEGGDEQFQPEFQAEDVDFAELSAREVPPRFDAAEQDARRASGFVDAVTNRDDVVMIPYEQRHEVLSEEEVVEISKRFAPVRKGE
jgi:hypothetical protein